MKDVRFSTLLLLAVFAGCGDGQSAPEAKKPVVAADPLLAPTLANKRAPDEFRARFTTTKGDFIIKATRKWSPAGVDRLYNLIDVGYFHDTPFYRFVPHFIVQFGFHSEKKVNAAWNGAFLPAEPNRVSNMKGTITFAQRQSDERSTQLFINLENNAKLDNAGFSPVAIIVEGLAVVESIYPNYGESPSQRRIANETLAYLNENYPSMDYIKKAELLTD